MGSLEQKFSYLDDFMRSFKTFSKLYEEKKDSDISFESIFKRLNLIEKFIFIVSQKLDVEKVDRLSEKCNKDPEFLFRIINNSDNKSDNKSDKVFNPIEAFLNDSSSDSSEKSDKDEDEDEDDKSSVSSIDDINSKDSDSTDSEDNDSNIKEELNGLNKMIAKSILEFNMRRELKDFGVEKNEDLEDSETKQDE
jgi:hypothetical protein